MDTDNPRASASAGGRGGKAGDHLGLRDLRSRLRPRFLPEIRPTEWNYVVDIHGAWAAGRYRFMQRYRSGMEHNRGEEFDAPFARIDRMGQDRFDIYWMRHTGKWWRLHAGVTLAEALRILETDSVLHPV